MPQPYLAIHVIPIVIGPTVNDRIAHAFQRFSGYCLSLIEGELTCNTAHEIRSLPEVSDSHDQRSSSSVGSTLTQQLEIQGLELFRHLLDGKPSGLLHIATTLLGRRCRFTQSLPIRSAIAAASHGCTTKP